MKNKEFVKTGVVIPGETPSERSGGPSEHIKKGQALKRGEEPVKDISKLEIPLADDE
jgi:hypothetical protein